MRSAEAWTSVRNRSSLRRRVSSAARCTVMSVLVPNQRTIAPEASRTGSARDRNQRYSPSWRRSGNVSSQTSPLGESLLVARDHAGQVVGVVDLRPAAPEHLGGGSCTREIVPSSIVPEDRAPGVGDPGELRQRFGEIAEVRERGLAGGRRPGGPCSSPLGGQPPRPPRPCAIPGCGRPSPAIWRPAGLDGRVGPAYNADAPAVGSRAGVPRP